MSSQKVRLLLSAGVTVCGYGVYRFIYFIIRPYFSPLRALPGPPSPSFVYGNRRELAKSPTPELLEKWASEYGETFVYKFVLNADRLITLDLKANAHFLNRTDIYQRPETFQQFFTRMLGAGLLVTEGEHHRTQRRALNPAFGWAQVNELSGVFLSKANEMRDRINESISRSVLEADDTADMPPNSINMTSWLAKTTLDIIGLAGFLYPFDSLSASVEKPNELYTAFGSLFSNSSMINPWNMLVAAIPWLRYIPVKQERDFAEAKAAMRRIGMQIIEEKKAAVRASTAAGEVEKAMIQDRDLLSLLVRANMAKDLPDSQRLSDEDVIAQIPTFLAAGHETTSTLLSWILHELSINPDIQERLREEVQTVTLPPTYSSEPLNAFTLNALNSLPFIDAVIRESLRLHSPVANTPRVVMCDDVIPLEKPVTDRHGVLRDFVTVKKGDHVLIPILMLHRSTSIWGPDAKEFNPNRWLGAGPPPVTAGIPGVYSNLLSFLGGVHSCIGWRFSLLETKILLHVLISNFKFAPAVNGVYQKTGVVSRPTVRAEVEKPGRLPMYVSRAFDA